MIGATAHRLATLRPLWITAAIALVLTPAMTALTGLQIRENVADGRAGAFVDPSHLGLDEAHLLLPAALVMGVLTAHQEYATGTPQRGVCRQSSTTALALPRRARHAALEASLTAVVAGLAGALATGLAMGGARLILEGPLWAGDPAVRLMGIGAAWAVMALLAHCLTHVTRTAIFPLLFLLLVTTLVPAWALLRPVTRAALLLPDAASIALFHPDLLAPPPPVGVAVLALAAWCAAAIVVTAFVRERYEA